MTSTAPSEQPASTSASDPAGTPAITGSVLRSGISGSPADLARAAAAVLAERTGVARHDGIVVLGSGWAAAAEALGDDVHARVEIDVQDLPGGHAPVAEGHAGRWRSTVVGDRRVLVALGRTHLYEGHGADAVAHAVRTAAAAGARFAVLTCAAGALRHDWRPGTGVVLSDHLNLSGDSPLTGPRFVDLTDAWSPRLRRAALAADPELREGVYAMLRGPHYQSWAEAAALVRVGADLVGMSTVLEAVAARAEGLELLGLAVVASVEASDEPVNHESVLSAASAAAVRLGKVIADVVAVA